MGFELLAHIIILTIMVLLVSYVIYVTFDAVALLFGIIITGAIITINPRLFERVEAQCAIQYYVIILIATILFSIEICNNDSNLLLLLILAGGVTLISLYVGQKSILYLSVFLNTYLIGKMGSILWHKNNCPEHSW